MEGKERPRLVIEIAQLPVAPGREVEFERAMVRGREILENAPGSGEIKILRGVESPSTYVLLVEWESVEQHHAAVEEDSFLEFRELLRGFYEDKPVVQHFAPPAGPGLG